MSERDAKPVRKLELHVDIDASPEAVWKALTEGRQVANWFAPEAESEGSGAGSKLTFAWSEQMRWTTNVDVWEPGKRVRWFDENVQGDGTALAAEWTIEAKGGKTRLTLVQSAFGASEGWEDFFSGTEAGWTYFLHNLRLYLERHPRATRRMISARPKVTMGRDAFWRWLRGSAGELIAGSKPVVDIEIPRRLLALRYPDLGDALLMLELEPGEPDFSCGCWLSVYDDAIAAKVAPRAQEGFTRLAAASPAAQRLMPNA